MNNIYWHKTADISLREKAMAQRGMVIWFTGLSGSGKSTIAVELEKALLNCGFAAALLDGDNVRHGLCGDLGFSPADRDENIRRIAHTAALMEQAGMIVLVSAISPFAKMRDFARSVSADFNEVYVNTPLDTCIARDVKGLYKKALAGEIPEFTGISSPYEVPQSAEVVINTDEVSLDDSVGQLIRYVIAKQLPHFLKKFIDTSVNASFRAGTEIMKIYSRDFGVETKSDNSPLTQADKASNAVIEQIIRSRYPYFAMLLEETADDLTRLSNDFCVIVDPLDGTKEFIKRNGEFTVNIGLSYRGEAVCGVVYAPASGLLWYGAKSLSAWMCDTSKKHMELFNDEDAISVSERSDNLVVMLSRSHQDEQTLALLERNKAKIARTVASGSSLKGCHIASGEADVYYRLGLTSQWDTCAMQAIVEAAGGIFVQGDFSSMRYNREDTLNRLGFVILNNINNRLE